MKIVQQISWQPNYYQTYSESFIGPNSRAYFEPGLFTGVQKIYFEVTGRCNGEDQEGEIELYDYTNEQSVAVLSFTGNVLTRKRSADLSAILTEPVLLGVRCKFISGFGTCRVRACGASLVIQQDDEEASRKTAMYYPMTGTISNWWSANFATFDRMSFRPQVTGCDGEVKAYLQVVLRHTDSKTVEARLYDIDSAEAVPNSTVSVTNTAPTFVESGELVLDTTHRYCVQYRCVEGLAYGHLENSFLKITAAGFNKVAALPVTFQTAYIEENETWEGLEHRKLLEKSLITGNDSLSWGFQTNMITGIDEFPEVGIRLYNNTKSQAVEDTTHVEDTEEVIKMHYDDTPAFADCDDDEVEPQSENYDTSGPWGMIIVAYQQENLPAGESIPADPTQPSGYHCFMSQFLRNVIINAKPLKTPDGINKCW